MTIRRESAVSVRALVALLKEETRPLYDSVLPRDAPHHALVPSTCQDHVPELLLLEPQAK